MNPFEMVAFIVVAVMVASVFRAKYHNKASKRSAADDPETQKMRDELQILRDRVAVLERIATDKEIGLEREIERLRDS
ncbi:hypothetical protein [Sphingosinicella rhizophila]|uniref:Phage shock protein B n=1 Tax=Sphingosinicella rhizophila TaxID=3050082 RepID=A0ABU3Q2A6_9SPHN|nr:hypothetical protein [Sphingosinicella sp. GR2756]MDT9597556.1 hypothetical protein [Sphingosinicella sp. GR2756]